MSAMLTLNDAERKVYLKYADLALPRHTSYPAVPFWKKPFTAKDAMPLLEQGARDQAGIGLYIHTPFCRQLCYYCACNKEIVPDNLRAFYDPVEDFLIGLELELESLTEVLGKKLIRKLHFGGGSPSFLTPGQMVRVFELITRRFSIAPDAEIAIELDPRTTSPDHLSTYAGLGMNRISLGIQDFDERVQRAVGRSQPFAMVADFVERLRSEKLGPVNFDLIYGLPWQTMSSLEATLERVLQLKPDRIAYYRLAVIPEIFKWQRAFSQADLPSGEASLDLGLAIINRLSRSGYSMIGLDHFALENDALAIAAREGSLARSFQGMETGVQDLPMIGLGPSAISTFAHGYYQNAKGTRAWLAALQEALPVVAGICFSEQDRRARAVIQDLYCNGVINRVGYRERFDRDFDDDYQERLPALVHLVDQGILQPTPSGFALTSPLGRMLVRVSAAALDLYLSPEAFAHGIGKGRASQAG